MSLNDTPRADRLHIGIFGRRNAGKSSLINALTGQQLAIVSDAPGTTADPVFKAMELHPVGPVVFIDTAGFDDTGDLGLQRVAKSEEVLEKTDLALLVLDGRALASGAENASARPEKEADDRTAAKGTVPEDRADAMPEGDALAPEKEWAARFREKHIPALIVINKGEELNEEERSQAVREGERLQGSGVLIVSAKTGENVDALRKSIARAVPRDSEEGSIVGDWISDGGLALLVMPQDIQAPKGRLILPQVQTIRELLDRRCTVVSTTADGMERALSSLSGPPDLIITDSQCFREAFEQKPKETGITSFSILMASAKGDLKAFVDGVRALEDLVRDADPERRPEHAGGEGKQAGARILIAEACTHVPQGEDIGTVKIPRLLRKHLGEKTEIVCVRGNDFPDEERLRDFDLIIHCGACMFNRAHVLSRIAASERAGVPITNYGVFLAWANGILEEAVPDGLV